jgi:hypothetical protein
MLEFLVDTTSASPSELLYVDMLSAASDRTSCSQYWQSQEKEVGKKM